METVNSQSLPFMNSNMHQYNVLSQGMQVSNLKFSHRVMENGPFPFLVPINAAIWPPDMSKFNCSPSLTALPIPVMSIDYADK